MNWFRVPMNVITCATLLCLHVDWVAEDKRSVFAACVVLAVFGVVLSTKFAAAMRALRSQNGGGESGSPSDAAANGSSASASSAAAERQGLMEASSQDEA